MANDNNVVDFTGPFFGHIDPERVLNGAKERGLAEVVIVGEDEDGELYIAFSSEHTAEVILLLERAKHRVICDIDDEQ